MQTSSRANRAHLQGVFGIRMLLADVLSAYSIGGNAPPITRRYQSVDQANPQRSTISQQVYAMCVRWFFADVRRWSPTAAHLAQLAFGETRTSGSFDDERTVDHDRKIEERRSRRALERVISFLHCSIFSGIIILFVIFNSPITNCVRRTGCLPLPFGRSDCDGMLSALNCKGN